MDKLIFGKINVVGTKIDFASNGLIAGCRPNGHNLRKVTVYLSLFAG